MPAELVAIAEVQERQEDGRAERLRPRTIETRDELHAEMDPLKDAQLWLLINAYASAEEKRSVYGERRALKAERDLLAMLGADLTDDQRARVLSALRVDQRRDPHLLSKLELAIVGHYRSRDAAARQMVRTLLSGSPGCRDDRRPETDQPPAPGTAQRRSAADPVVPAVC